MRGHGHVVDGGAKEIAGGAVLDGLPEASPEIRRRFATGTKSKGVRVYG